MRNRCETKVLRGPLPPSKPLSRVEISALVLNLKPLQNEGIWSPCLTEYTKSSLPCCLSFQHPSCLQHMDAKEVALLVVACIAIGLCVQQWQQTMGGAELEIR